MQELNAYLFGGDLKQGDRLEMDISSLCVLLETLHADAVCGMSQHLHVE